MAERDECVYRAKLAEQAERYDGKHTLMWDMLTAGAPPAPPLDN